MMISYVMLNAVSFLYKYFHNTKEDITAIILVIFLFNI